jgi:hypothetical protein
MQVLISSSFPLRALALCVGVGGAGKDKFVFRSPSCYVPIAVLAA